MGLESWSGNASTAEVPAAAATNPPPGYRPACGYIRPMQAVDVWSTRQRPAQCIRIDKASSDLLIGGIGEAIRRSRKVAKACKRKEQDQGRERSSQLPKKQRLVFTDLQRRTLVAIFRENRRPSKEMQLTISQQLGLELSTVSNFFMNSRRRSRDLWGGGGTTAANADTTEQSHGVLTVHGHMHHGNSNNSNNNNHHHHHHHHHHNNNNNNNNSNNLNHSPIQPGTSSAPTFSKV
ncbi:hypothetical protein CRUP_002396 [Coryphaenoides rupestris]|nr:hypothetical protein CRUP_002396 [Coryphaenoides rupestris]